MIHLILAYRENYDSGGSGRGRIEWTHGLGLGLPPSNTDVTSLNHLVSQNQNSLTYKARLLAFALKCLPAQKKKP